MNISDNINVVLSELGRNNILNLEITMVVLDMATAQSSIKNKPFALSLNALIT
jgi:hypothetical protein